MQTLSFIARTLFPHDAAPVRQRSPSMTSGVSQAVAIGCALLPLGVMLHALAITA